MICGVVLLYVFFGGMRGTAWANAFQTAVFMVLGLVTFVTIANALGGSNDFLENLKIATQSAEPSHLSMEKMPKAVFFSFLFIPLSVAMFPHVFHLKGAMQIVFFSSCLAAQRCIKSHE